MTDKNNVITINGTEYNEDTLTDEQKYAINQIKDLQSKYEKDKVNLDQIQVALNSFVSALIKSLEEEEVKVEKIAS